MEPLAQDVRSIDENNTSDRVDNDSKVDRVGPQTNF